MIPGHWRIVGSTPPSLPQSQRLHVDADLGSYLPLQEPKVHPSLSDVVPDRPELSRIARRLGFPSSRDPSSGVSPLARKVSAAISELS